MGQKRTDRQGGNKPAKQAAPGRQEQQGRKQQQAKPRQGGGRQRPADY